jgi:hypothetical protein
MFTRDIQFWLYFFRRLFLRSFFDLWLIRIECSVLEPCFVFFFFCIHIVLPPYTVLNDVNIDDNV